MPARAIEHWHSSISLTQVWAMLRHSVLAQSFGVGAAAVGATLTVYATARLLMNIPAGLLADRFGRRPLLVWGPAITAAGASANACCCCDDPC